MDEETPTAAERGLAKAVASGEWFDAAGEPVRGEVIRRMLLGRFPWPDGAGPDPRGIRLRGAELAGGLDLGEVETRLPLRLVDCRTTEPVVLSGARLSTVDLSGLAGRNVVAVETRFDRALLLVGARLSCASADGTVDLAAAHVGSVLDLSGAHLVNTGPDGPAFHGNNLTTAGGVFLNRGFRAEGGGPLGTVRLSGAELGGQLNLGGAWLVNLHGPTLVADYLVTRSNLMLDNGFHAEGRGDNGTLRFVGARIGGRLTALDGHAFAAEPGSLALNLSQAHVGGDVLLPVAFTPGLVQLDGFGYDGVPRGARLGEWLHLLAHRTSHYTSQPYFQLAAAHRGAGNERDVRRIHLARQRDLLRRGDLAPGARLWHRLTGLTVGFGYRPAVALLWWLGALLLSVLLVVGVAGPAGLTLHGGQPGSCALVEQVGLALNTATPLVKPDVQQRCQLATAGAGGLVVAASWLLQALAWAFVTLFVAGFTGLVRKSG
ncbi:hypothetical protein LWP59_22095 [Amycolatopsis acidiphila]|uniref:Oxidoreductase n=1 Tax=Amycolatopsis acidiphila TaxID=715473 RepID=A0A557ZRR1_9PSEU|nr:hypothetical protein [Amycolatopsis acidiphila]TVT14717.1 hypothetical protein FNH06_37280 [Amycolatopsis acidiphila]UIJ56861.1 hypothetical protein LWP59_22095 [Amycolatopsis acidiphila]GHG54719.1 hypothetical protein GCM10017788_04630 [Amycolatopsis acidiphila]